MIKIDDDSSTSSGNRNTSPDPSSSEESSSDDGTSSSQAATKKTKVKRGNIKATQLNNSSSSDDGTSSSKLVPKKRKVKHVKRTAPVSDISPEFRAMIKLDYPGIKFIDVFGVPYTKEELNTYMKKRWQKR